jgi:hypothetical protein
MTYFTPIQRRSIPDLGGSIISKTTHKVVLLAAHCQKLVLVIRATKDHHEIYSITESRRHYTMSNIVYCKANEIVQRN